MSLEAILRDLDQARRRHGLSKSELARLAETQPAAVRRLLSSDNQNPQLSTLAALAGAIGHEIRLVPTEPAVNGNGRKQASKRGPKASSPSRLSQHEAIAASLRKIRGAPFSTVLADPPWRFVNRTGKVAPEHRRLSRYDTMTVAEISALPVQEITDERSHLYLWVPNALVADGLLVMEAWGFTYKSNIVWAKRRKDGGPDGRGVGFYFRNVTELLLFGVRGQMRTLAPGRSQVNMIETRKREHSRKPDEQYDVIEDCSPGPYLEMFARYPRKGWSVWGLESDEKVVPRGRQYPAYR